MGDVGDAFRELRAHQKMLRDQHGIDCPGCAKARPKACPTIMLPRQRCKVCGYRDPRPRLTNEQTGWYAAADQEGKCG